MRRLAAILAFALCFAVPLFAQRGGHGGGGGGHFSGGGGGGHVGGGSHFSGGSHSSFSGSHSFSGAHSASGYSHAYSGARSAYPRSNFLTNAYRGNNTRLTIRTYGFRNPYYGYGRYGWGRYGYPWWGWGYYDPYWWWWNDDSSFDDDYNQNLNIANQMNQQSLDEQRARQEDQAAEDRMFQQEQADGDQDAYASARGPYPPARVPYRDPSIPSSAPPAPTTPTILVFRDQHKEEVENYAVVGQTLFNFTPQRTEKIALADLDLAATQKANDDRGITFRIPASNPSPALQQHLTVFPQPSPSLTFPASNPAPNGI